MGVSYSDATDLLMVADTYNHKIKMVSQNELASTLAGEGKMVGCRGDQTPAFFNEPGGLCFFGSLLFVADTNNHAIKIVDLIRNTVTAMKVVPIEEEVVDALSGSGMKVFPVKAFRHSVVVHVRLTLPPDYYLNENGRHCWKYLNSSECIWIASPMGNFSTLQWTILFLKVQGAGAESNHQPDPILQLQVYLCNRVTRACHINTPLIKFHVQGVTEFPDENQITVQLTSDR